MVEELLRELKKEPGLEGPLSARIIEDGDAVAAWEGRSLAAVLFPTGETLKEVRKVADARKDGLVLIINPQVGGAGLVGVGLGLGGCGRGEESRWMRNVVDCRRLCSPFHRHCV